MKPSRRLALRRENLAELDLNDLPRAAGGNAPPTWQHDDCSVDDILLGLTLQARCSWSCPVF